MTAIALSSWITYIAYYSQNVIPASPAEQPDAYMEDVTAVFLDTFGKPKIKITTPKLIHYMTADSTDLINPYLTIYRKSPKPWFISSRYAKATHGIDNINFREDVTIHHPGDENMPATIIKAPTLLVHPNRETAETNEHIELIQPNITVKATGMHANMNSGQIQLLSEAKGEYVPDPH